jgi:dihydrofolate reductase
MAKTILEIAVSLDGYIAGPHDELDWLEQFDNPSEYGFDEFIPTVGATIVGKRSYEIGVEREWFKDQTYGPSPIFVVSSEVPSNPSGDADFRFVTNGLEEAYKQAGETAGDKNIYVFGGASIIQQSLNKGLLDELHLAFVPVLLGQGVPLFANLGAHRIHLERLEVKTFPKGLTSVYYRVIK